MGQYFYFFNASTGEENIKPIDPDEPYVTWVAKLNYMDRNEILGIFSQVAKTNNWSLKDDVIACGDNGDVCDIIHYNVLLLQEENPQRDDTVDMCDTDEE